MDESFLGDGLIFEDKLPLAWRGGALPEGADLARLNADNQQLLHAESSLDDVRVPEALKEESPALLHELQRLEFKLNILLRLTAELVVRDSGLPIAQAVRLSARGLEWSGTEAPPVGESGILSLYVNPAFPQPLKIGCNVLGERMQDGLRVAQLRFLGLSDSVIDHLEKLIFRHHRRLVAGSKQTAV